MTILNEQVLLLAEHLNSFLPLAAGDERHVTPEYVLWMGPTSDPHHNVVQRLRIAPGMLPQIVERARAWFTARGRHQATWEVSQSATPKDLDKQLIELGLTPDHPDPVAIGMVRAEPLSTLQSSEVVAKRVETLDEYIACCKIVQVCFGTPLAEYAQSQFDLLQADQQKTSWIALLNGTPVAMADAIHLEAATVLAGGATLPDARGRGAYSSLLAARSDYAVSCGAPVLVTQAGSISRPILRKFGFQEVSEVRIFVDTF